MKDPIVQIGADVLRKKAKPITKKGFGSPALKAMIATMRRALAKEEFGVAIAAPQIGESVRVFVVAGKAFESEDRKAARTKKQYADEAASPSKAAEDMVFINPELLRLSRKKKEMSEGCLSVRNLYGTVLRHEKASVKAFDISGKPFIYHGSGLIAHIFQHECDHLDGVLYTDRAERLRKDTETTTSHVS